MRRDCRITDITDHGGVIVTGASKMIVEGQPTSRIGDVHMCPLHGQNIIVTGASKMMVEGQPTSRIGDLCACGAVIISGAQKLVIEN